MGTLGKTTQGSTSSSSSGNKTTVSSYTAGETGTVSAGHARLWVDSGTASAKVVVYDDNGSGAPGALNGISDALTVSNTATALLNFTFSAGNEASIAAGNDYWIGFAWADPGTNNISWGRDATSGLAQQVNSNAPDPFGTPTSASGLVDAYVDVTVGGGGGGGGGSGPPTIRSVTSAAEPGTGNNKAITNKPAGLAVGDYLLALHVGDADGIVGSYAAPSGFSGLAQQAGNSTNNSPTVKLWGKVAVAGDVSATTFEFDDDTGTPADSCVILMAITNGTYTGTPSVSGFTVQARTASNVQTAPSVTGTAGQLLLCVFASDVNNSTQSYPSSGPSGMTLVASQEGGNSYALAGAYSLVLASSGATGTKTVTPTGASGSNGWVTASILIDAPVSVGSTTDFFMSQAV